MVINMIAYIKPSLIKNNALKGIDNNKTLFFSKSTFVVYFFFLLFVIKKYKLKITTITFIIIPGCTVI